MAHLIAPSILSADFSSLKDACNLINSSEADWYHIDVMDGLFVPNISFGMPIIKAIKPLAKKPFDVHLMIVQPERYITDFKDAGADVLTVHVEACTHLHRTIQAIKAEGMKAGVSLNPHTSVSLVEHIIEEADLFLIMSVNPGFGGQHFIPQAYEKISRLKEMITKKNSKALIEVDGGVTTENARQLIGAGADVLVAGNAVFKSSDPNATISALKHC
jgi:ribulose-phosphate 3-epimerase